MPPGMAANSAVASFIPAAANAFAVSIEIPMIQTDASSTCFHMPLSLKLKRRPSIIPMITDSMGFSHAGGVTGHPKIFAAHIAASGPNIAGVGIFSFKSRNHPAAHSPENSSSSKKQPFHSSSPP